MSAVPTPSFIFNETQRTPVLYNANVEVINKLTELKTNADKTSSDITLIHGIQNNLKSSVNSLNDVMTQFSEICKRIEDSVTEIKEKLSQYDIDAVDDEYDTPGRSPDDDLAGESGDNAEGEQSDENQPDGENNISNNVSNTDINNVPNQEIFNVPKAISVPHTSTNNEENTIVPKIEEDYEEMVVHDAKTKRKYTKRGKK